jgi:hypothetical protein
MASDLSSDVRFAPLGAPAFRPPPLRHSNSFTKNRRGEYDAAELLKQSFSVNPPLLSGRCCHIYDPCCCTIPSSYLDVCLPDEATHNFRMTCCSCKCLFEYFVAELCCLWSCGRACYQGYRVRQVVNALIPTDEDSVPVRKGAPKTESMGSKSAVAPAGTNGHAHGDVSL